MAGKAGDVNLMTFRGQSATASAGLMGPAHASRLGRNAEPEYERIYPLEGICTALGSESPDSPPAVRACFMVKATAKARGVQGERRRVDRGNGRVSARLMVAQSSP